MLEVDPKYHRPAEIDLLQGDASKARQKLGWTPEYDLKSLVKDMMASDIALMKKEQFLKNNGYQVMGYFE